MLGLSRAAAAASLFVLAVACAPPNKATPYPKTAPPDGAAPATEAAPAHEAEAPPAIARYFDREVDLRPFLAGFPYSRFVPSLETGKLFFYHLGDTYSLRMLDISVEGSDYDLSAALTISDVDWSKRSLWGIRHTKSGLVWLHADANNDEQMNLWTLDTESKALTQLTFHDYVYGFGFNADESVVAYLPRQGKKAPYRTCLRVRQVAAGTEREVLCDTNKLSFTWSRPVFSPSGREVYFNAQTQGDRNRVQLVRVDLEAKRPVATPVTDPKVRRNSPEALRDGWVGDDLLFLANDDGYRNLYAYSRKTDRARQLSSFKEDLVSAHLSETGIFGVHRTPAGSTLVLMRTDGTVVDQRKLPGTADARDAHGGRALVTQEAPDVVFEGLEVTVQKNKLSPRKVIALDPELERKIVQCKASSVRIPTFDKDKRTGQQRELHAFLLEPRRQLDAAAQRLAFITAFYGGRNAYQEFDQILCAAGFTVVSPAVRGSSGFGRAFSSLNDKDLGGNEIVDLFWVARWLDERAGLGPRRIGVYGGSHGGYATMRALTFPPGTNGHKDNFDFGFGMSHAGFSDIKTFYDATNIPDWVVLESGDPNKPRELARMKDRSPLTHANRLRAPILLTHGSQDWRVPVEESRQFVTAARKLKRPVTYVEIEGQGHSIQGLDLKVQAYQARFDFLMAVAKAAPVQEK